MAAPNKDFKFDGKFSAGSGGAGSSDGDVVLTDAISKMTVASAAADDEDDEDDEGDAMATLPRAVLKRVLALRNMHSIVENIDEEYKRERIALEQKYMARREEQYLARHKVITGEVEPAIDSSQLEDAPEDPVGQEDVKGIPEFWSQCLLQHPSTAEIIQEEDMPLLEQLSNITCTYDETYTSFTLHFHFNANDYFTNTVLTKKYGVTPDLLDDKSPALTLNEGTEIEWKAGKNLTVTEIKKKQKAKSGKNKGQVRTIITQEPKPSFFNYFSSPKPDDEEEDEEDEDDGIKLSTEDDYDIGHSIRTAIIPEAIMWYTGEADDGENDEDDDGDDEEDEDSDEEDSDEEESAEEEQAPVSKGNKKGKKGANKGGFAAGGGDASGTAGEQPECKQN